MGSPPSSPSSYSASYSSYAPRSSSDEQEEDESLSDDKIETKSKRTATPKRVVQGKRDATHRSNTSSSRRRRRRGRHRPDSEEGEEGEEEEETDDDEEETEEEEEETEGDSRRERRQSHSQPQHHQPLHQPQHHQPQHHHQRSHHHHHRHRHHQRHHHHHHQRQHHEHHQPRNVYRKHVVRRAHQKRVDAVDIPAPAEWLYHDAYAALRLRWEAQADLQLYADQKRRHEPRISINFGSGMVERGLVTAIQRVTNNPKIQKVDRKAPRLVVGGDLLPWGTWPTRLRNHDGQSFYAGGGRDGGGGGGGGGDILLLRDAVDGPFASCWAGSGGVGCSGGVEGVDSVTEDSIHDQLLLRRSLASQSPSPSCPPSHAPFGCSSSLRDRLPLRKPPLSRQVGRGRDDNSDGMADDGYRERRDHHHHEGTVRRLVPDGRGRWVEARAEPSRRASGAATSGGDTQGATAGPRSRSLSSPLHETSSDAATTATIATTPAPVVAKRLVPGWYGGWAEVEDTPGQTARAAAAAAAAAVVAARPGPDDGAACSVLETWKTSGRKRQRGERVLGTAGDGDQGGGTDGAAGGGGGEEDEDGGRAERRRCNDSDVHARGGGEGLSDSDGGCRGGGGWRGWTVSEPAKEAVRRVWGRATRRARDAFEPRHRCGAVTTDGCPTPERKRGRGGEAAAAVHAAANCHAATAAESADCDCEVEGADSDDEVGDDAAARDPNGRNYVDDRSSTFADPCGDGAGDSRDEPSPRRASPPRAAGGVVRDRLDPGLLSCLGRECEGIIDAALHVVLGEQLLRSSSRSSSECVDGNPPEAADWQDVLSTMSRCSKRARRASPRDSDPSLHARGGGGGRGGGRERGAGGGGREGGGRREREGDMAASGMGVASSRPRRRAGGVCTEECPQAVALSARGGTGTERREVAKETAVWGAGEPSDGAVVVVNERLPGLPLSEAVLTRSYNRLLVYLHEKKSWEA